MKSPTFEMSRLMHYLFCQQHQALIHVLLQSFLLNYSMFDSLQLHNRKSEDRETIQPTKWIDLLQ